MTMLPQLGNLPSSRERVTAFRGLNRTPAPNPDEWADMENLSSAHFPAAGPRGLRGFVRRLSKPNGLFARDRLAWVDGTDFTYDGIVRGQVTDCKKQFVAMGAYLLIWPDKLRFHTETGELTPLEARTATSGTVRFTLCRDDGTAYEDYASGETAPENPADGKLWVDTRSTPHCLRQWSSLRGMWVSMPTTYIKISAAGIGQGLQKGDGVTIAGCENASLNGDMVLQDAGPDFVVIIGLIEQTGTQEGRITVERTVPDMDFLTESGNRVWGCSSAKHEVYACKLGDPTNWRCYQGLTTDSYAATIGTAGAFTGAVTHRGAVLFFKEDVIHRVYGYKPANFEITEVRARGVQKGSEMSLCVVNETLYYKAPGSVCAYGTAMPMGISEKLGGGMYGDAVAGALDGRYYLSMTGRNGPGLYVFDERLGFWYREDSTQALAFARLDGTLYGLRADGWLFTVDGTTGPYAAENAHVEKRVDWMAETGDIGISSPDRKRVRKVQLRISVERDSLVKVWTRHDYAGDWTEAYRLNPERKRSHTLTLRPRRCDTMRIRITGHGTAQLHEMTFTLEGGSDK